MPDPMGGMLPPLTLASFFSHWQFDLGWTIVAALLLASYAVGVRAAGRRGTAWPLQHTACWLVGVALLVLATQGGIAVYGDALFWLHMVGHLTLIMIAPIALLLGRPLDLAVAAGGDPVERALQHRAVWVVTFPLLTLGLYTVVIVATHLTGFMDSMMVHPWLHGFEGTLYLVAGLLFFAPIVADSPLRWRLSPPSRMFLLAVAMPVDTFTGVILIQTQEYPWPRMAAMHPMWASSLLDDLHSGGAVMWIGGDAIMFVLMGVAAITWARLAGNGMTSELGGWLSAARVNYQRTVAEGSEGAEADGLPEVPAERTGDSDEDLADYNAYLARLNARERSSR